MSHAKQPVEPKPITKVGLLFAALHNRIWVCKEMLGPTATDTRYWVFHWCVKTNPTENAILTECEPTVCIAGRDMRLRNQSWLLGIPAMVAFSCCLGQTMTNPIGKSTAQEAPKPVPLLLGRLEDVPVRIPPGTARFVEYDDDPPVTEARKRTPATARTYDSRLRSLRLDARYPDMTLLSHDNYAEMRRQSIHTTMWMRIGIESNSHYGTGGDDALERHVSGIRLSDKSRTPYTYDQLPGRPHGLTGLTPVGIDESRRGQGVLVDGKTADIRDKNVYYHRNSRGRVDAYIECGNMKHSASRCVHRFNMLPAFRAHVSVDYRRDLLPQWADIQTAVRNLILGFRQDMNGQARDK